MALVFFDFETGGVLPSHPNIQLAAVAVNDDFAEMESYETKIQVNESDADPEADRAKWRKCPQCQEYREVTLDTGLCASCQLVKVVVANRG